MIAKILKGAWAFVNTPIGTGVLIGLAVFVYLNYVQEPSKPVNNYYYGKVKTMAPATAAKGLKTQRKPLIPAGSFATGAPSVDLSRFSIEFYPKDELARKLDMPILATQTGDPVAHGEVLPHRGKTTVVAMLTLGEDNVYRGSLLSRPEPPPPRPWFEWKKDLSLRGYYYPVGNRVGTIDLVGKPFRTKAFEWEGIAGAGIQRDGGMEWHVGVGASYPLIREEN